MRCMFDDRPFETDGDIHANNHRGKTAEEIARGMIANKYGNEPVDGP